MADAFVTQFMAAGFSVVERSQIEAIFKELNLNYAGVLSQQDLKEIGKVGQVDALVFGSMSVERFSQSYQGGGGEDKEGKLQGVYAYASAGLRTDSVSLRMVDVETGEVVLTSTFENVNNAFYRSPEKIPGIMMDDIREKLSVRHPNARSDRPIGF